MSGELLGHEVPPEFGEFSYEIDTSGCDSAIDDKEAAIVEAVRVPLK